MGNKIRGHSSAAELIMGLRSGSPPTPPPIPRPLERVMGSVRSANTTTTLGDVIADQQQRE